MGRGSQTVAARRSQAAGETVRLDWLQSERAADGVVRARIMTEGDIDSETTGASALAEALVG